jgi:hypothetical protein
MRLPAPPSDVTGPLGAWLTSAWRVIEAQPRLSYDSFDGSPNSRVTGLPGDLLVNFGSASTNSRLWILGGGSRSVLTNQGWCAFLVTPL